MIRGFVYQNIALKKHEQENWLVLSGDIVNRTGRNYHAVVFRVTVFIKSICIGNAVVTVNGFAVGQKRGFKKQIGDLEYGKVINDITNYEIYAESAY
jgi:proteasome assembly chaperone (PAC2) family protein